MAQGKARDLAAAASAENRARVGRKAPGGFGRLHLLCHHSRYPQRRGLGTSERITTKMRSTARRNASFAGLTSLATALLFSASTVPVTLANPVPQPATPRDHFALVSRSDPTTRAELPCGVYQGQVGAIDLADLYLVTDKEVREGCLRAAGSRARVAPYAGPTERGEEGGSVGPLFWLRSDTLEIAAEEYEPFRSGGQFVLSGGSESLQSSVLVQTLAGLNQRLAPKHVLDLPVSAEGALVLLSLTNATHRLAQLDYLTSHPLLAHYTLVAVPLSLPPTGSTGPASLVDPYPAVPQTSIDRLRTHLDTLAFQPTLSAILRSLHGTRAQERIRTDVRILSGEDQRSLRKLERWTSRHSMSEGGHRASNWVYAQMSSYGFDCRQLEYLTGFAPMVECVYRDSAMAAGVPDRFANETVVLSAHFDSRGSFGLPTAPGADDDASGTSLVLAVARTIWQHRLRFSRKLVLALYSGEEQGLTASAFHAKRFRSAAEDIMFMLQVDMVGYRKPGEPMQLARPDLIGLPEAGYFVGNVSELYAPELVVGYTPACCSDHQSYVAQGYPATWIFERNGPIADPCYHNSCDLSRRPGYSFEQIAAHTRVAFATVWEIAGGRLP
ncbi:hypothetical protein JCM8202_001780 [Rhodotorula sphaerocarpa]